MKTNKQKRKEIFHRIFAEYEPKSDETTFENWLINRVNSMSGIIDAQAAGYNYEKILIAVMKQIKSIVLSDNSLDSRDEIEITETKHNCKIKYIRKPE